MEWYLLYREENCVFSHVNHIYCRDNVLITYFSQANKNKEGMDLSTPWNMQSNKNKPVIYLVNALEMHLLDTQHLMGDSIFPLFTLVY